MQRVSNGWRGQTQSTRSVQLGYVFKLIQGSSSFWLRLAPPDSFICPHRQGTFPIFPWFSPCLPSWLLPIFAMETFLPSVSIFFFCKCLIFVKAYIVTRILLHDYIEQHSCDRTTLIRQRIDVMVDSPCKKSWQTDNICWLLESCLWWS